MDRRIVGAVCALSLLAGCGASAVGTPPEPRPTQIKTATASAARPLIPAARPLASAAQPPVSADGTDEVFYADVPESAWYHASVKELCEAGILPGGETFGPGEEETRIEYVTALYRLHLAVGGEEQEDTGAVFTDVPAGSEGYLAALWAKSSGVTSGISATEFDPSGAVTREQGCAFVIRTAAADGVRLAKTAEAAMFTDSARVSRYARSYMAACQMAGILAGENGRAVPDRSLSRAEAAAILCRLYRAALRQPAAETECVALDADAYLSLYDRYNYVFGQPVPESGAVPASWFDDAVFVGDSLTVGLQMYCTSTGALSKATFLCTPSLSAPNALAAVTDKSLHPTYNGVKMKVEDAVAACGAKNVYIMLGINNMYSSIDVTTQRMVELIGLIREKSPEANIILQSVTPLTSTSNIVSGTMNNPKIEQYNARMREYCAQYGWYYIDVASAVRDENGCFNSSYCGDAQRMGIHFNTKGAGVWVNYLRTHVPEILK